MKNCIKLALIGIFLIITGCASLTSGANQGLIVEVKKDKNPPQTTCTAENDRGTYIVVPGKKSLVRRSRQALHIECYNATQFGALDVPARRRSATKVFNFFIDFCSISCLIDRKTGKGYGYTNRQTVYLMDTGRGAQP